MSDHVSFYVDGTPRTKGSWRPIRRADGGTFMKPSTDEKPWAMAVAWSARAAKAVKIPKPKAVHVSIWFDFVEPKKATNHFPKGDADKLARSVLDALTGIAYDDDAQVSTLIVHKRYGAYSGARIIVAEIES